MRRRSAGRSAGAASGRARGTVLGWLRGRSAWPAAHADARTPPEATKAECISGPNTCQTWTGRRDARWRGSRRARRRWAGLLGRRRPSAGSLVLGSSERRRRLRVGSASSSGASPLLVGRNGLSSSSSSSPSGDRRRASEASPAVSSSAGRLAPSSRNGLYSPSPVVLRAPRRRGPRGPPGARAPCGAATFAGAPVPAGISLPMMTFSLSPIRWSLAPLMAASVSTRVVSWKDAAARKRRGVERRLGHAEQDGLGRRRLAALGQDPVVVLLEVEPVDELGRQQVDVARLVDADLAEHLPDDDLDVLVVDRHALAPVDLLDFLDQVALDGVLAPGVEVLLRVDRAVGDRVAGPDLLAVLDEELGVVGDRVLALDDVLGPDDEAVVALDEEALDRGDDVGRRAVLAVASRATTWLASTASPAAASISAPFGQRRATCRRPRVLTTLTLVPVSLADDLDDAVDVADLGLALGDAGLEQLLDARQAGGDVQPGDAAGVERPHRQLGARLADRLGGDDADRLAGADHARRWRGCGRSTPGRRRSGPRRSAVSGRGPRRSRPRRCGPAISSVISSLRSTTSGCASPFLTLTGRIAAAARRPAGRRAGAGSSFSSLDVRRG